MAQMKRGRWVIGMHWEVLFTCLQGQICILSWVMSSSFCDTIADRVL